MSRDAATNTVFIWVRKLFVENCYKAKRPEILWAFVDTSMDTSSETGPQFRKLMFGSNWEKSEKRATRIPPQLTVYGGCNSTT
jgi:hypothetical protein